MLIVAGLAFQSYFQHNDLKTEIVRAKEQIVQTATSEWMSGGMKTTVTTSRLTGETNAEFAQRHREAVDSMLRSFPKDT